MRQLQVLFLCALLGYSVATEVQSCDGDSPHEHAEDLQVGTCVKPPCKLKRKTTVNLEFKFTADDDVRSLKNNVHAKILGVPFPFLGVDGTDACNQIYKLDGTKAGCPLKKGEQYLYKNSIRVHEAYPKEIRNPVAQQPIWVKAYRPTTASPTSAHYRRHEWDVVLEVERGQLPDLSWPVMWSCRSASLEDIESDSALGPNRSWRKRRSVLQYSSKDHILDHPTPKESYRSSLVRSVLLQERDS